MPNVLIREGLGVVTYRGKRTRKHREKMVMYKSRRGPGADPSLTAIRRKPSC